MTQRHKPDCMKWQEVDGRYEFDDLSPCSCGVCQVPPAGWYCTRTAGHDGPCAARQDFSDARKRSESLLESLTKTCLCQSGDVGFWCENCQRDIDKIASELRREIVYASPDGVYAFDGTTNRRLSTADEPDARCRREFAQGFATPLHCSRRKGHEGACGWGEPYTGTAAMPDMSDVIASGGLPEAVEGTYAWQVEAELNALKDAIAPYRHTEEDRQLWQEPQAFVREIQEMRGELDRYAKQLAEREAREHRVIGGPWRAEKVVYPSGRDVSFEIFDGDGKVVCGTYMREIKFDPKGVARDEHCVNLIVEAVNRQRRAPSNAYSVADVRALIRSAADAQGSYKNLATAWDVSPQYLSDILAGRREPGRAVLQRLGLAQERIFVPAPQDESGVGDIDA